MLTQEQVKDRFDYNPLTGVLTYRKDVGRKCRAGTRVGGVGSHGYRQVNIGGTRYLEHRLIWLYMTGAFPVGLVDHVDHCKTNNVWSNLREADHSQNRRNSTAKGFFERNGKFYARAILDNTQHFLGSFETPDAAHDAFVEGIAAHHADQFNYAMP